jgi:hypothetical protein
MFNHVKNEDFSQWPQELEAEPRLDTRLWSTSDEELDLWNLFNQSPHNREDSGLWFIISALVECVNYYDR